jgi:hypothetical protein
VKRFSARRQRSGAHCDRGSQKGGVRKGLHVPERLRGHQGDLLLERRRPGVVPRASDLVLCLAETSRSIVGDASVSAVSWPRSIAISEAVDQVAQTRVDRVRALDRAPVNRQPRREIVWVLRVADKAKRLFSIAVGSSPTHSSP